MALLITLLPLALYALAALLFLLTVKRFLPVAGLWRHGLLAVVSWFSTNSIVWLGDAANILFIGALLFLAIPFLCGGRKQARFSVALLLFCVVISTTAVLSSLRPPLDSELFKSAMVLLLWLCITLFVRRFIEPETVQTIRPRLWHLLDAAALLPFGVTVFIVLFAQATPVNEYSETLIIGNERVLLLLLLLSAAYSVGLLLCVALLVKQEGLERRQMLLTVRQQYYESLEQNQLQVRRLRHDMANHLNAMAGMEDAALREYLTGLIASPAMAGGRRYCENEVVNAVLATKLAVIEDAAIEADVQVALPARLPLADIDLCAIFANCIDNAVEACLKCPPGTREITLRAKAEKGIFALRLENSMAGTLAEKNGSLATTKPDRENHGLGMAEIQDIARQHSGVLQYGQIGTVFQMQLSIPLHLEI